MNTPAPDDSPKRRTASVLPICIIWASLAMAAVEPLPQKITASTNVDGVSCNGQTSLLSLSVSVGLPVSLSLHPHSLTRRRGVDAVADNVPRLGRVLHGLEAAGRADGMGVAVERRDLRQHVLLDTFQAAARGRAVGVDDAPGAVRRLQRLAVADSVTG